MISLRAKFYFFNKTTHELMSSAKDTKYNVPAIAAQFAIYGDFVDAFPYGSGHINDTFCAVFDQGACRVRYIIQRVNSYIFKNPED